jgi:hypothetical protein
MKELKAQLGEGAPVDIDFFEELVAVRDSIIHADSKIAWSHNKRNRPVADKYANTEWGGS